MKVLILGSGGREHALAWKLSQSHDISLIAAPGNPGMGQVAECIPTRDGRPETFLAIAERIGADLTVVGPEAPLVAGVVDLFRERGRKIVGPNREAAQLEGSKVFAKNFLTQRNIPTAAFVTVDSESGARDALNRFGFPVVLKADGLAAGKGVIIAHDRAEAEAAIGSLMGSRGSSQSRLVLEEFLQGREVTFIALCDGRDVLPLAPTQDHKAALDDDKGPNTGGMGAYCDSAILTAAETQTILNTIIRPTVEATRFSGFLYAGLMMTPDDGPKVLEFNVRLGDPETQPLMHRMSSPFLPALLAAANSGADGRLGDQKLEWRAGPSVCVVLASEGYPGPYSTGKSIHGMEAAEAAGATVFQAGTKLGWNGLETAGGRVLGITAGGRDLTSAIHKTYEAVRYVSFEGMHYRTDIGRKGLR